MNNAIEIYSSQDGSIQQNVKLENNTDNDKHYSSFGFRMSS